MSLLKNVAWPLLGKARISLKWQGDDDLSANEMGGYDTQEFAGGDDLGVLPELGEMALIARHQVVCTCAVRTFNENVVCRVGSDLSQTRGFHDSSMVLD